MLILLAVLGMPVSVANAADCADVDLSFARGTREPAGVGVVGQTFIDAVTARPTGTTISTHPIAYPATFDFSRAGEGANDLSSHLQQVAADCPNTRFVLGGYDQGAGVVSMVIGSGTAGLTYNDPLPDVLDGRIAAVVLFGNPRVWPASGGAPTWSVPDTDITLPIKKDQLSKVISLCNARDMICDPAGGGYAEHGTYGTNGSVSRAADFVVERLRQAG